MESSAFIISFFLYSFIQVFPSVKPRYPANSNMSVATERKPWGKWLVKVEGPSCIIQNSHRINLQNICLRFAWAWILCLSLKSNLQALNVLTEEETLLIRAGTCNNKLKCVNLHLRAQLLTRHFDIFKIHYRNQTTTMKRPVRHLKSV